MLARGETDVALIPLMGYFTLDHLVIAPGMCIGSRGPVESIRLFYRGRLDEVRRVHLDSSSMTSAALTRIILKDRYGLSAEFVTAAPPRNLTAAKGDAVLLIGDRAMQVRSRGWKFLDLGVEWKALTGLPFVYAVWAARKGTASRRLVHALNAMKALGLARLAEIAKAESRRLGLSSARCRKYLSRRIFYDLGAGERAGMNEFRRRAIAHGLIDKTTRIRWARRGGPR
jgi:chorismate dehydratase